MIFFDTNKEAYEQRKTIEKWGRTYLTKCTEEEYQELLEGKRIWQDDEIVINPNYEQELAKERQETFEKDFFNIEGFGWFRRTPKGYGSAVESINTAFNVVTVMRTLPQGSLTFYTKPDFYNPDECTEEWLVEHQIKSDVMTAQEFGTFYAAFIQAWNAQEHL